MENIDMRAQMGFYAKGAEPVEPGPNRAQRRAAEQNRKRQQRRGQRAYLRAIDAMTPEEAAQTLDAIRGEL